MLNDLVVSLAKRNLLNFRDTLRVFNHTDSYNSFNFIADAIIMYIDIIRSN